MAIILSDNWIVFKPILKKFITYYTFSNTKYQKSLKDCIIGYITDIYLISAGLVYNFWFVLR